MYVSIYNLHCIYYKQTYHKHVQVISHFLLVQFEDHFINVIIKNIFVVNKTMKMTIIFNCNCVYFNKSKASE